MRDLLITNIRLQKSLNFLTHSLKVSVWPIKILELNLWMSPAQPLDPEVLYLVQNGSEQSRGALPSLSTVKDITAHDSGDSGAHTMRNRQEVGETLYTSVSPVDHDKNLVEDSAPFKGTYDGL